MKGRWDLALFCNNLTDERAFLALDRERGTRARIGYLTNQPRTLRPHGPRGVLAAVLCSARDA